MYQTLNGVHSRIMSGMRLELAYCLMRCCFGLRHGRIRKSCCSTNVRLRKSAGCLRKNTEPGNCRPIRMQSQHNRQRPSKSLLQKLAESVARNGYIPDWIPHPAKPSRPQTRSGVLPTLRNAKDVRRCLCALNRGGWAQERERGRVNRPSDSVKVSTRGQP